MFGKIFKEINMGLTILTKTIENITLEDIQKAGLDYENSKKGETKKCLKKSVKK